MIFDTRITIAPSLCVIHSLPESVLGIDFPTFKTSGMFTKRFVAPLHVFRSFVWLCLSGSNLGKECCVGPRQQTISGSSRCDMEIYIYALSYKLCRSCALSTCVICSLTSLLPILSDLSDSCTPFVDSLNYGRCKDFHIGNSLFGSSVNHLPFAGLRLPKPGQIFVETWARSDDLKKTLPIIWISQIDSSKGLGF